MPYGLFDYGGTINTMGAPAYSPSALPAGKPAPTTQSIPQYCPPTYTDPSTKGVYNLVNCPPKIVTIQPPQWQPTTTLKNVYTAGVATDGSGIVVYNYKSVPAVPNNYTDKYGGKGYIVGGDMGMVFYTSAKNAIDGYNASLPASAPKLSYNTKVVTR